MQRVSAQYKDIMNRPIRNRAYISVGIGIVNNEAQKSGKFTGEYAYWSNETVPFEIQTALCEYATMEQNFFKADGSMLFLPENDEYMQLRKSGLCTYELLGGVRIEFGSTYDIKGMTVDFGESYPTKLTVNSESRSFTYTNDKSKMVVTDVFGETSYIEIVPVTMRGGMQRLRIKNILMGVGINYSNSDVKFASMKEIVHSISEELPSIDFSLSVFDYDGVYDVDNDNSFINYLDTMQTVSISYGLEMDDGHIEFLKVGKLYLKNWNSKKGEMKFTATDRLSHMEDTYSLGNKIYERTAYDEAINVFTDAGLEPDEYFIDECLQDIDLINPMPEVTHKEALQLLANASRCILKQDHNGIIRIVANFANVIEPDDMQIIATDNAAWSHVEKVLVGSEYVYADMTKDFFRLDGSQSFFPDDEQYSIETGYVSGSISDEFGLFVDNPVITVKIPAAHSYYGIHVNFDGNHPSELIIHTYRNNNLLESAKFKDISQNNVFNHDFLAFDTLSIEFTKGYPNNRILVNKIAFGDVSDYIIRKKDMLNHPVGYKEEKIKNVLVKIFSFENNEEGNPQEIEDDVYYLHNINIKGKNKVVENPLVSTEEHAQILAEWIGNYYYNNISYDVNYRGEPRLNAADIIYMESDFLSSLQVEIESSTLDFNGAFRGKLSLRRALNAMEV